MGDVCPYGEGIWEPIVILESLLCFIHTDCLLVLWLAIESPG